MTAVAKPERANLPARITSDERVRALILPYLPAGVSLERVAADVRLALAKDQTGALENCTPASVFLAVATIAKWNLSIGETAHLVPFGTTCTPIADYKGLAEMVIASGVARHIEAHCVYEKEPFRLKRGTPTEIEHHPIGDPKARGVMIGAYALFHLRGGLIAVEYMSVEEIEEVRQQYSKQWKKGPLQTWYARKCPVRRGVKLLPRNPALLAKLAAVDVAEGQFVVPRELEVLNSEAEGAPVTHRIQERTGPKPLSTEGAEPYDAGAAVNNAPAAPAQFSEDPGFTDADAPLD